MVPVEISLIVCSLRLLRLSAYDQDVFPHRDSAASLHTFHNRDHDAVVCFHERGVKRARTAKHVDEIPRHNSCDIHILKFADRETSVGKQFGQNMLFIPPKMPDLLIERTIEEWERGENTINAPPWRSEA